MFRFEELDIWKLAIDYANEIYNISNKFPDCEKYNLIIQVRKAALSISSNIAEGSGTRTNKNFSSFLDISVGSALETVNLLYFAKTRNYISETVRVDLYNKAEVLIKKIRSFKKRLI
ncbi:MAG: four helix bundle protein [Candidatus Omnitrophota bacterium]|jgi:four helix bundle protein